MCIFEYITKLVKNQYVVGMDEWKLIRQNPNINNCIQFHKLDGRLDAHDVSGRHLTRQECRVTVIINRLHTEHDR